jgi:hypothetical protein
MMAEGHAGQLGAATKLTHGLQGVRGGAQHIIVVP